jgi:hypothetical protein
MRQEGNKETKIRDFEDQLLLGSKWEMNKTLRRGNEGKSQKKKLTQLLPDYKEVNTELDLMEGSTPSKTKKRKSTRTGGTGGRSTGLPSENECAKNECDG